VFPHVGFFYFNDRNPRQSPAWFSGIRHLLDTISTSFSKRKTEMTTRLCNSTLAFLALTWLLATPAIAAEIVEGTIESLTTSKIAIKDKAGKIHSFDVDSAAKITLDGKTVKLDTLGVGSTASVSTETKNNKTVAVTIDARSKMAQSAIADLPQSLCGNLDSTWIGKL
jgi:hypothetical protein